MSVHVPNWDADNPIAHYRVHAVDAAGYNYYDYASVNQAAVGGWCQPPAAQLPADLADFTGRRAELALARAHPARSCRALRVIG